MKAIVLIEAVVLCVLVGIVFWIFASAIIEDFRCQREWKKARREDEERERL